MTRDEAGATKDRWLALALLAAILILSMTAWFSATAVLPDLQRAFALSLRY